MDDLGRRKRELLAALLGMTNASVGQINQNTMFGREDGENLSLEGVSKDEFIRAMDSADTIRTSGLNKMRGTAPTVPPGFGSARPTVPKTNGDAPSDPATESIPFDHSNLDIVQILQSIDSTLQSILQVLLTGGVQPGVEEPKSN